MRVIADQTKAVRQVADPAAVFGEQGAEHFAVFLADEHLLPYVATLDDLVQSAWRLKARFWSHCQNLLRSGGRYTTTQA
jgi:hypothetical protein